MKTFLNLLVVLIFIASDAFPQNFIKINECRRFIGKSTHSDFIINESELTVNKFDSVKFCTVVTKIYESLNLFVSSSKDGLCLMGSSWKFIYDYSVSFVKIGNIMYFEIMNTSEPYKVYTKDEFNRIRKFQIELAERFYREVRRFL